MGQELSATIFALLPAKLNCQPAAEAKFIKTRRNKALAPVSAGPQRARRHPAPDRLIFAPHG
ncbi:hypothetical protein HHI_00680 [Hyphomonas hirschiana VP5]|uniref:Uncharacterized protein n=1 Tax=Hyphomonas hirschiana VP5 TaxID=1280951 RepID=A0A059G0H9_9PROT|nr:hypothetical protein HHI_00680 [Hyphomonas hirschiana VP5]